jgi:hypothetical protein
MADEGHRPQHDPRDRLAAYPENAGTYNAA